MPTNTCRAAAILETWNLIHDRAEADVVRPRQPSRMSTRVTLKLESSLDYERGVISIACAAPRVESWNVIDSRAADFVCLRRTSRKDTRLSQKLESSLDEDRSPEIPRFSNASLFNTSESPKILAAPSSFEDTTFNTAATGAALKTQVEEEDTEGNCRTGDKSWLSDTFADMSTRPSSTTLSLASTCSVVSSHAWDE